eukprot:TRINITY_DN1005_c0_g1_i1.p1 TRINITY_DN1005_c0_g1~~TRINITY_DN1005_c0_g1_i1.p1  ORF type:complete len:557 (+),score=109.52 TRINITY_DN1005_c0_g1_i1:35-1672(+)
MSAEKRGLHASPNTAESKMKRSRVVPGDADDESRFGSCPVCGKQVAKATMNSHVATHFDEPTSARKPLAPIFNSTSKPTLARQQQNSGPIMIDDAPTIAAPTTSEIRKQSTPLAERMRPVNLDEVLGHNSVVGPGTLLRNLLDTDRIPSMILWGPPGCGKTTLAKLICKHTRSVFKQISAVNSGLANVRDVLQEAANQRKLSGRPCVLFIDEIHRYNKLQQDTFLPAVENGTIILIGATTENPSFELNSALLSRCRVFVLQKLTAEVIGDLIKRALTDCERGFGALNPSMDDDCVTALANVADGDARVALNALEMAVNAATVATTSDSSDSASAAAAAAAVAGRVQVSAQHIESALQRTHLLYDKSGDQHYDIISALHKSVRGSDTDATMYWLGRMLAGGDQPLYIARRLIRMASEDIGLADPNALTVAVNTFQACHFLGKPECDVMLFQCAAYMARAPKSIAVYAAMNKVMQTIKTAPNTPVPIHLRNAPTVLMKQLGYGEDYLYNPDHGYTAQLQEYLPQGLEGTKFCDVEPSEWQVRVRKPG